MTCACSATVLLGDQHEQGDRSASADLHFYVHQSLERTANASLRGQPKLVKQQLHRWPPCFWPWPCRPEQHSTVAIRNGRMWLRLQAKDEEQEAAKFDAVFPCILRIIPQMVFNKKDPIIVGVDVEEGIAKVGLQTADRVHVILDSACIATLVGVRR